MSTYINNLTFIERTKKIVCDYEGEYDVSLIINACVGLLFVAKEKHHGMLSKAKSEKTLTKWGLNPSYIQFCGRYDYRQKKVISHEINLSSICTHIRNSIAHCNFKTLPERRKSKIEAILLRDFYVSHDKNKEPLMTFEAKISIDDFKKFIMALADYILDNNSSHDKRISTCN